MKRCNHNTILENPVTKWVANRQYNVSKEDFSCVHEKPFIGHTFQRARTEIYQQIDERKQKKNDKQQQQKTTHCIMIETERERASQFRSHDIDWELESIYALDRAPQKKNSSGISNRQAFFLCDKNFDF